MPDGAMAAPFPTRVAYVVYVVRPEDFDAAVAFWEGVGAVRFEHLPLPDDRGLRIAFSLEHGVEVVAPTSDAAPARFRDFLASGRTNPMSVVYAVPDADAAEAAARAAGVAIQERMSLADRPPYDATYDRLEEIFLERHLDMEVRLIEIRMK